MIKTSNNTSLLQELADVLTNYRYYTNKELGEVVRDIAERYGNNSATQELAAMRAAVDAAREVLRSAKERTREIDELAASLRNLDGTK
jgi:NTP pyrophosphatase (non-canonical NTP hydrolase)